MANVLSNIDLEKILSFFKIRAKILSKDQLPKELTVGNYIMNMQDTTDGNGTHWVSFNYSPSGSIYFDAFGAPPPEKLSFQLGNYISNHKQIQDIDSSSCGYYCIGFLLSIDKSYDYKSRQDRFLKYIDMFSDNTKINDTVLYEFINRNKLGINKY